MQRKDLSLEGLRGIAALVVVINHALGTLFPYVGHWFTPQQGIIKQLYDWEEIVASPFVMVFFNASFAVSIFFVLSGYVLTKKFFEADDAKILQAAAVKRYPRLMLPALASAVFAWALLSLGLMQTHRLAEIGGAGWPMAFYSEPISFWSAAFDGAIGAPFAARFNINAPLWSIRVELIGSFVLFAAYLMFGSRRLMLTSLAFAALAFTAYARDPNVVLLLCMLAGSLFNRAKVFLEGRTWLGAGLIVLGLAVASFCYAPLYAPLNNLPYPAAPFPLPDFKMTELKFYESVGAILLVAGVMACNPAKRVFSARFPVYLGRISFSMYLIHWPIVCSLMYGLMALLKVTWGVDYQIAALVAFGVSLVVIFGASDLFERYVDRPAIAAGNVLAGWVFGGRNDSAKAPAEPTPQPVAIAV